MRLRIRLRCGLAALGAALAVAMLPVMSLPARADGIPLHSGDVLVGVGNGLIKHFDSSGNLLDTLNTTSGSSEDTGMCFDSSGNLYSTNFEANSMSKFDSNGNLVAGSFGSGFNFNPESCSFNTSDQMYVGQADGNAQVLKLDTSGNTLGTFAPAREDRGTDWVDLAKDQCTLYYTSEGSSLKAFNVCTNTQLPDVATGLPAPCYAHRVLADNTQLVACETEVLHLAADGSVIQTYNPDPGGYLFALNIDPDGTSYWTADINSGQIYRIDIASGTVLTTFNASAQTTVAGITVVGEVTQGGGGPPPSDQPISATGGQTFTGTEPAAVSGTVATFTDPDPASQASEYSATIDWGDGNTSAGTVSGNTGGPFTVTGSNTYADEGSYAVKVTITDTDNASNTATVTDTANISDASLSQGSISSPGSVSGQSVSLNAGFSDANSTTSSAADFTATIDWGDGNTTNGTVGGSGGSYSVTGSHTYTGTGFYTIKVHVADDGGSTVAEQKTVLVYGTSAGGNFVISSQKIATGTSVTFWGAQWAKFNPVAGTPPTSFKGFEDTPKAPLCGQSWQTNPGNSTPPPNGPLPAYMLVLASSTISSTPSNAIKGNTVHEVVVKTNPGYGPQPSTPGTGTVVAEIC